MTLAKMRRYDTLNNLGVWMNPHQARTYIMSSYNRCPPLRVGLSVCPIYSHSVIYEGCLKGTLSR